MVSFQGKVELELEILTEEEARERPAGRSREEPYENPILLLGGPGQSLINLSLPRIRSIKYYG